MRVFIDTSAFIALLVSSEMHHAACVKLYGAYTQKHALFHTNVLVLAELYTRLIYDVGKNACATVMRHVHRLEREGSLRVFQLDAALFALSENALLKFAEHKLSLTDASIYIIAKTYSMDEIFTLDQDFQNIGLSVAGIR